MHSEQKNACCCIHLSIVQKSSGGCCDTYRGHGDDGPPVGVEHGVEGGGLLLLLEHEDEGCEHDGAHPQQQEQQPQLLVVGLHGVAQRLEAGGMFC